VIGNENGAESVDPPEWMVDELAGRAGLPVRTIREYQTIGLLPPPRKRGRVGLYSPAHLARLHLIGRLQERGYSLAGISDLLQSWTEGADLGEVLGLVPDQLVHIDEPGVAASLAQLAAVVPGLVPDRLGDLLAAGAVEACGPGRYCIPSPSLLQLAADALAAGVDPDRVIGLLTVIGTAASDIADSVAAALAALPATAGAQAANEERKTLLVNEDFDEKTVGDENFVSLDACLTAATELIGEDEFDSCADQDTGPVPAAGGQHGYLQFTDAGKYHAGGIIYNDALPSKNGIEVTFSQYQYGGTGADGISFFLVDGDTDLTKTGAIGGSLGYAQIDNDVTDVQQPGVEGGYLGLGLDAWGNFSADTEGRGAGCPEGQQAPEHLQVTANRAPNNVALRGPGDGYEGYCLLGTTATEEVVGEYPDGLLYGTDFPESLTHDTLEDAKRNVKLKVMEDGDGQAKVTVDLDFMNGDGWTRVLEAEVPQDLPKTFKFGFASSTGGETDVHLLRHLRVESLK
jgi:DNA-binding transcriptional MerR regulator